MRYWIAIAAGLLAPRVVTAGERFIGYRGRGVSQNISGEWILQLGDLAAVPFSSQSIAISSVSVVSLLIWSYLRMRDQNQMSNQHCTELRFKDAFPRVAPDQPVNLLREVAFQHSGRLPQSVHVLAVARP